MRRPGHRTLALSALLSVAACRGPGSGEPASAPGSGGAVATAPASSAATASTLAAAGPSTASASTLASGPAASQALAVVAGAAATTGSPAPEPAALPAPPLDLVEAVALVPGAATPLTTAEAATVDPGVTFRVVVRGTAVDVRLSLLDGADAMVPSAGGRESGPTTTLTLQPAAPLRPGSHYRLRVDGATARDVRLADGTARSPLELAVLVAGDAPPETRAARPKAKKKR